MVLVCVLEAGRQAGRQAGDNGRGTNYGKGRQACPKKCNKTRQKTTKLAITINNGNNIQENAAGAAAAAHVWTRQTALQIWPPTCMTKDCE